MTTIRKPYFIKNKQWYYCDYKEFKYKLTSKTSKEAIDSYNEFYNRINKLNQAFKIEDNLIYLFYNRNITLELGSYISRFLQSAKEKKYMIKYLNNYKGNDESYISNAAKRIHNLFLEDNL